MTLDQTEITNFLFKENGPTQLLSCISEDEKLSPESEQLLLNISSGILEKIVDDACFSAKSRGSDTVDQSDLQFITDPWIKYERNNSNTENEEETFHNKNIGSIEHQQRLEMIRHFMEMKDTESNT